MIRRTTFAPLAGAALLAAALLAATPAGATQAVLGRQGELVTVENLTWGELDGEATGPVAEDSVLALRLRYADGGEELIAIPNTVGPDDERTAALLYEESSETFYVAWESVQNFIHSRIRLVGYRDGEFTAAVDVSDARFSLKSDPQLAVTRDSYEERDAEGNPVVRRRTALHVVWTEERAEGLTVAYSPLVLLDGEYGAPGPIFALTELVTPPAEELLAEPLLELPLPATVRPGEDSHSVVIGFVHPQTGDLVAVDLALLPGEVSSLADGIRAHIIESGHHYDTQDPGQVQSLSGIIRAHIIENGHRLEPGLLSFLADEIRAHIIENGHHYDLADQGELQSFSDVIRAHIIENGFHLEERGLQITSVLGVGHVLDFTSGQEAGASHQVSLGVASARPLEGLEAGAAPAVLLSPGGTQALVAWEAEGELHYQETQEETWSAPLSLALEGLGLAEALSILEHRIENR